MRAASTCALFVNAPSLVLKVRQCTAVDLLDIRAFESSTAAAAGAASGLGIRRDSGFLDTKSGTPHTTVSASDAFVEKLYHRGVRCGALPDMCLCVHACAAFNLRLHSSGDRQEGVYPCQGEAHVHAGLAQEGLRRAGGRHHHLGGHDGEFSINGEFGLSHVFVFARFAVGREKRKEA